MGYRSESTNGEMTVSWSSYLVGVLASTSMGIAAAAQSAVPFALRAD